MMEAVKEKVELHRYPEYKDSGVDWLEEIPSHWEILPGYAFLKERSEKNTGMKESRVLSLSYGNVIVKPEEKLTGLVPESFETYQLVYPGDIIIRPTDLQNDKTSLRTGFAKDKGIITSAYMNLSVVGVNSNKYFHYLFHSIDTNKVIYGLGSGLRQNLSYDDFKRFPFPVPSPEEQTAIANFLDQKTEQIDQAIDIKQKQIELLKERRQIVVQNIVTRGLNPDVPLKPSGVDWIGEIPEHWKVSKLKYYSNRIVDGSHFTPNYVDEGIPFLRVTDISDELSTEIDWDKTNYISKSEHLELVKRAKPERGDILLSKNGTIGKTRVIDWDREFSFFVSLCLIKPTEELNPYFFCQFFNSPLVDEQLTYGSSRTSVTNLHLEKIKELLIVLPPIDEQLQLAEHLKDLNKDFNESIKVLKHQMEILKEYKTTLINSAVTGKIKVS